MKSPIVTPQGRLPTDKAVSPGKKPPLWVRMLLWATCGLVSFFHGQNDGQKGIGLVMMILISIVPGYYSLNEDINLQSTNANLTKIEMIISSTDTTKLGIDEKLKVKKITEKREHFLTETQGKFKTVEVDFSRRFSLRTDVVTVVKSTEKLLNSPNVALSKVDRKTLENELFEAKKITDYSPSWVVLMISICLGLGTMIGWKRVVKTLGEKIGKQHMSYAQGASAEIVASMGIGMATYFGMPVSTTHMLSSGIMGSMVAKKGLKNLQRKTITNIILAWVLTLPVTIVLSGGLFLLFY